MVRVLFAREILRRSLAVAKLLRGLVARDGIEPPTPAFSGPLTESPKWFKKQPISLKVKGLCRGGFRIAQDGLGCFRVFDVRVLYAPGRVRFRPAWRDYRP